MSFSRIVILQLAILAVVLESDLGRKKIGWFRVARPVIVGVAIVPVFFTTLPTSGNNLWLQGLGAAVGIVLGLISVSPAVVSVSYTPAFRGWWARRQGHPGRPAAISTAGARYALVWIVVSAARLGFAYTSQHTFPHALGRFLLDHHLTSAALTNALTFLALGMDLFRSAGLLARAANVLRRARPSARFGTVPGATS